MKNPFLILLLSLLISCCTFYAKCQHIEWQNTIGGNGTDGCSSIIQTSDSGYVCAGHSSSYISGDITQSTNGSVDYIVIKLDRFGNIEWQNTFGGFQQDYLEYIEQTSDDGFICIGRSNSIASGDKSEPNIGNYDYWVVKLDASGVIEWENTIGGSEGDFAYEIHQTIDGGYICGGNSRSDISGDKTENSIGPGGEEDYWIVKLDPSGNIEWQNTIGGNSQDFLRSIKPTSDGGYIVGGHSNSPISGDKTVATVSGNFWILKLDSLGNIVWQKSINSNGVDFLEYLDVTGDGGFVLCGITASPIGYDKTEASANRDYWVIKLDSLGSIEWQNTIGGDTIDNVSVVYQTLTGGYICGGYSYSGKSVDKSEGCLGSADYWILYLDENGRVQWQNTIGGDSSDYLHDIAVSFDGGFVCAGSSLSGLSGDKAEANFNQAGTDMWIVKLWGNVNYINGDVYGDLNLNNQLDPGEPGKPYKRIHELSTGNIAFSGPDGNYFMAVLDSGSYEVKPEPETYFNSVPLSHQVVFTDLLQSDSLNDFALQPVGTVNDLAVTLTPTGIFRAGFDGSYMLSCFNIGNTALNATVVFYKDTSETFLFSSPPPTNVYTDSLVYSIGTINPFETKNILITVNFSPQLLFGSIVTAEAAVNPQANDVTPLNNNYSLSTMIRASYDPNIITVDIDTLFDYQLANPPALEYTIMFQNTGNDTAFYVEIDNQLLPDLIPNTIEFIASSHPCTVDYSNYDSTLRFRFENILLPDSNINEPESHGFVKYRIMPVNTLVLSDTVMNQAGIIFDFNAPVITEFANTFTQSTTGLVFHPNEVIKVFPNPASTLLNVTRSSNENPDLIIFNVYGQKIQKIRTDDASNIQIDISALTPGIYYLHSENGPGPGVRFIKY